VAAIVITLVRFALSSSFSRTTQWISARLSVCSQKAVMDR